MATQHQPRIPQVIPIQPFPAARPGSEIRSWVEIDLAALTANARIIQQRLAPSELMAVVKKDAYGHGLVECARVLEGCGAVNALAVYSIDEGLALRQAGIRRPILTLAPVSGQPLASAIRSGLTLTVTQRDDAEAVDRAATAVGRKAIAALKIDTGLGRLGHTPKQALAELAALQKLKHLEIREIYSHLADPEDADYSRRQGELLNRFISQAGLRDVRTHLTASSGLRNAALNGHATRVGLALYGIDPREPTLAPVMQLRSRVIFRKRLARGESVSYGRTFIAPRELEIAVVGAGYGNGWLRRLSNRGEVLLHGRRAKIIGRICMDQFMIDVDQLPQCRVGDVVTLFGRDEQAKLLPAHEAAQCADTIAYELCCLAGAMNPKYFLQSTLPANA